MNTPASEQEWPNDDMHCQQTGCRRLLIPLSVTPCPRADCPRRPPAGVDKDVADAFVDEHYGKLVWADPAFMKRAVLALLRSHHAAVTAAWVDTVGHTDVTVTDLAKFLTKSGWWDGLIVKTPEEFAQALLDQFNVTRKPTPVAQSARTQPTQD